MPSKTPTLFELETTFRCDAAEIITAREKSKLLHHSSDIDASGDEVEIAIRHMLSKRMPTGNYVGHGHIVDRDWSCSGQLDVVIADTFSTPVLFRSQNGTEYFPYESVYAVGEIKSSYNSREDIIKFQKNLLQIKKKPL